MLKIVQTKIIKAKQKFKNLYTSIYIVQYISIPILSVLIF